MGQCRGGQRAHVESQQPAQHGAWRASYPPRAACSTTQLTRSYTGETGESPGTTIAALRFLLFQYAMFSSKGGTCVKTLDHTVL